MNNFAGQDTLSMSQLSKRNMDFQWLYSLYCWWIQIWMKLTFWKKYWALKNFKGSRRFFYKISTGCLPSQGKVRQKSGNSLYPLKSQGKIRESSDKSGNFSKIGKSFFENSKWKKKYQNFDKFQNFWFWEDSYQVSLENTDGSVREN